MREMGASQSHISNSVVPAHFGLGDAETVDVIEVYWSSDQEQELENVDVNQELTIEEPTGT